MTCHESMLLYVEPIEELRYLVLGAQREGNRALSELLRPLGLTPAQAEVIAVLRDAPEPLSVREIGERLVCETGSPSRLVGSVVAAGLAQRAEHPNDRRAVALSLTQAGRAAARKVTNAERGLYDWLAEALGDREVDAVVRALRKLVGERPSGQAIARRSA
jgi:DNA-binding MarR family transcriptional regulator